MAQYKRAFLSLLLGCCLALLPGCDRNSGTNGEGGPSKDGFRITPSSHELGSGDGSVILRAIGGDEPLSWEVSDPGLGTLTPTEGRTVNYRTVDSVSQGANVVRVTDGRGFSATSTIRHDDMVILPADVTLMEEDERVIFTVTGGVSPFTWTVGDNNLGFFPATGTRTASYQRNGLNEGTTFIRVRDGTGVAAQALITQRNPPEPEMELEEEAEPSATVFLGSNETVGATTFLTTNETETATSEEEMPESAEIVDE